MSNIIFSSKREEFIEYYKNKLFELDEGCWVLNKTGRSSGYYTTSKLDNVFLPDKIYNKFNQIPIYSPIIEDIKYMIDNCEVKSFNNNILFKINNKIPKKYSILLKFEGLDLNNRFYICYDYEFSKLKYPSEKTLNDLNNLIERKKDIEYKLYILENLSLAKL